MSPLAKPPATASSSTPVAVIFDFDGTLANSRDAAWRAFERVDRELGLGIATAEAFYDLFADSFHASLERACGADLAKEAWARYAEILDTDYSPHLVPGIAGVIRDLAERSPLAVMSANTIRVVRRALEDADVAGCFGQAFCGEKLSKRDALERFLADPGSACRRGCGDLYEETCGAAPDVHRTVLVTDTTGDIRQALAVGVRTIGVSWGMHSPEALRGAGAEAVVVWPQEIPDAVDRLPHAAADAVIAAREASRRRRVRIGHGRGSLVQSPRVASERGRAPAAYRLAGSIAALMPAPTPGLDHARGTSDARSSRELDEEWVIAVEAEAVV